MDATDIPLWVPLLVAGLGLLGTLAGGLGGVVIASKMAKEREDVAWTRERQREQERWDREDRNRTFEHRRTAQVEFYEALRSLATIAHDYGMGTLDEARLPEGWEEEAFRRLQYLRIYSSPHVVALAMKAYDAAWQCGRAGAGVGVSRGPYSGLHDPARAKQYDDFHANWAAYNEAEWALLQAIRDDLLAAPTGT